MMENKKSTMQANNGLKIKNVPFYCARFID